MWPERSNPAADNSGTRSGSVRCADTHIVLQSLIYRDAVAGFRDLCTTELLTERDALEYQRADIQEMYGGDTVALFDIAERIRAAERELAPRERLYAAGHEVPDPHDHEYERWAELAKEVAERVDIVAVFEDAGWVLAFAGRNSARRCEEWAGPCLACGGTNRMRVWRGGPRGGGYWCRQCGISGNSIIAYRNLYPSTSFYRAVRELASGLGLPLPARVAQPRRREDGRVHWPGRGAA